jgi:phosphopantothenoylcysteine decarboxylase/phosphopantothenate--cysteine ligase
VPTLPSILITAGPTHEPIDLVRFIGNRSSGKMGIAIAHAAASRGYPTTLLLGPVPQPPPADSPYSVLRFRTAADLSHLLDQHAPNAAIIIMAAAVADYRPRQDPATANSKFRRTDQPLVLNLESTPDLLAGVSSRRRPGQYLVGFALEPRAEVESSSLAKLQRKSIDMVVGNPLETMDADGIDATIFTRTGNRISPGRPLPKADFASFLLDTIESHTAEQARTTE